MRSYMRFGKREMTNPRPQIGAGQTTLPPGIGDGLYRQSHSAFSVAQRAQRFDGCTHALGDFLRTGDKFDAVDQPASQFRLTKMIINVPTFTPFRHQAVCPQDG